MIESSVVFLDSGIGGLPYLEWVRSKRPDLPMSYVADTANFPYGESSADIIRKNVSATSRKIFAMGKPSLLVVACNTASVAALDVIRSFAPCPVVGTVPAVKSAAGLPGDGAIGVLATKGTVDSPYLKGLIDSFAPRKKIVKVAAGDIVRFVEEQWLDAGDDGALPVMEPALRELRDSGVESVVIGCTHFLHVMEPISQYLGSNVVLVDSRAGVGKRILSLLGLSEIPTDNDGEKNVGEIKDSASQSNFYVTKNGGSDRRYQDFAVRYGLNWAGELP